MKTLLTILLLASLAATGQKRTFTISLAVGNDYSKIMNTIGVESGFYGIESDNSFLATFRTQSVTIPVMAKYGRMNEVQSNASMYDMHSIGLKYTRRVVRSRAWDVHLVAHPWYVINRRFISGYAGARISFKYMGDQISFETGYNPFIKGAEMAFIFSPLADHKRGGRKKGGIPLYR